MPDAKRSETKMVPPNDIEAERAVLGSIIKNQAEASEVFPMLQPEDFYNAKHQEIYKALLSMAEKDIAIDMLTTFSELEKRKSSDLVGGMTYLATLSSEAIVTSNAVFYAQAVKSASDLRSLIKQADLISQKAYGGEGTTSEILDFAEQRIFEIAQKSQRKDYELLSDVLIRNITKIQEIQKNKGQLPGITTGFRDLDKLLGGFQKTDLIILAARPGMGKTAMALNLAQNAAADGKSVLIFSLEMSKEQLGQRMLAMSASVDMESLKKGGLSERDWEDISSAQDEFENRKISIDDTSDISILEIKNKCRRLKNEQGLDLIVIDYLQLMSLGYKTDNRVQEISAITRSIKVLAKELDIAVIMLSQLSRRGAEKNAGTHRPQLTDLRDSGSIEQDADIVVFLNREDYYEDGEEAAEVSGIGKTCEVIVSKHRNGPTGTVKLAWIAKYTKFSNIDRYTTEF